MKLTALERKQILILALATTLLVLIGSVFLETDISFWKRGVDISIQLRR